MRKYKYYHTDNLVTRPVKNLVLYRGVARNPQTSKVESFATIVKGFLTAFSR